MASSWSIIRALRESALTLATPLASFTRPSSANLTFGRIFRAVRFGRSKRPPGSPLHSLTPVRVLPSLRGEKLHFGGQNPTGFVPAVMDDAVLPFGQLIRANRLSIEGEFGLQPVADMKGAVANQDVEHF